MGLAKHKFGKISGAGPFWCNLQRCTRAQMMCNRAQKHASVHSRIAAKASSTGAWALIDA
jgi:hypothetical protein